METLSEAENAVLGGTAAFIEAILLQPTLYWKNAAMRGEPFTLNPFVVYRGISSGLVNEVGSAGVQFVLTGLMKHLFLGGVDRKMTFNEELNSALLGGCISAIFTSPVELLMIQQQSKNLSLPRALKDVTKTYSLSKGLYRGFGMAVIRDSIYVGGMLGTTPLLQEYLVENKSMDRDRAGVVSSIVGGGICALITCPPDVIKTCMQGDLEQVKYRGSQLTARQLIKEKGLGRLMDGAGWRSVNIIGTFLVVNYCCTHFTPYMIKARDYYS